VGCDLGWLKVAFRVICRVLELQFFIFFLSGKWILEKSREYYKFTQKYNLQVLYIKYFFIKKNNIWNKNNWDILTHYTVILNKGKKIQFF